MSSCSLLFIKHVQICMNWWPNIYFEFTKRKGVKKYVSKNSEKEKTFSKPRIKENLICKSSSAYSRRFSRTLKTEWVSALTILAGSRFQTRTTRNLKLCRTLFLLQHLLAAWNWYACRLQEGANWKFLAGRFWKSGTQFYEKESFQWFQG